LRRRVPRRYHPHTRFHFTTPNDRMTANRSSMSHHAAGFVPAVRGMQGARAASRSVALPVSGGRLAP
jgi:hypothetical protein